MQKKVAIKILEAFVLSAIIISAINLFYNRSLWLDEAMIALNIRSRNYSDLLVPLDLYQAAPIGFLLVEKFISSLFNYSDWSFRILPFFSYIFSVYFFKKLCRLILNNRLLEIFTTALFSLAFVSLYFSNEVKQYILDLFTSTLLLFLVFQILNGKNKYFLWYSILTAVLMWFSNITIILFTVTFGLLLVNHFRNRNLNLKQFLVILIPLASFLIYYFLFLYQHPSRNFMIEYWSNHNGFFPQKIFTKESLLFLLKKVKFLFGEYFYQISLWPFLLFLSGLGIMKNFKKPVILITLIVFVLHLGLSWLKLYPFEYRFLIYSLPLLLLTMVMGFETLLKLLSISEIYLRPLYLIIVFILFISSIKHSPFKREEIKQTLDILNKKIKQKDALYIYTYSVPAFTFYKNKFPKIANHPNVVFDESANMFFSKNFKKFNINETSRSTIHLWLLFSHISSTFIQRKTNDDKKILAKLKNKGWEIVYFKKFNGALLYKMENLQSSE